MDCTDVCSSKWTQECGGHITASWSKSGFDNESECCRVTTTNSSHSLFRIHLRYDHSDCIEWALAPAVVALYRTLAHVLADINRYSESSGTDMA